MHKPKLFPILIAISLCAAGCGDDNNNNNESKCGDKICSDNQECKDDVCVDIEDPDPIVDEDACKKAEKTCKDDKTQVICEIDKKPVEKTCDGKCQDGECIAISETACKKTENTCDDDDTLIICVEESEPETQKCSETVIRGACQNGECISLDAEIGSECENDECPSGSYCNAQDGNRGTCIAFAQLGESCEAANCVSELMCDAGVCKTPIAVGDTCGDLLFCKDGRCEQNICSAISELHGACGEALVCPDGAACIENVCTPTKGACKTIRDCSGDSYCCLDAESCGSNLNACIPYSADNPNNTSCQYVVKPGVFDATVQCAWRPVQFPNSNAVVSTVVSGKIHNRQGIETPLIAFVSYYNNEYHLRIVNPENCEEIESAKLGYLAYGASVVLVDIDSDGYMELITNDNYYYMGLYSWDETKQNHILKQRIDLETGAIISAYDFDDDGTPELCSTEGPIVHVDGMGFTSNYYGSTSTTAIAGDLNGDGSIELLIGPNTLRLEKNDRYDRFSLNRIAYVTSLNTNSGVAYADFGTPGSTAADFDFEHLDGIAEIVYTGYNGTTIYSAFDASGQILKTPQMIMRHAPSRSSDSVGYQPVIADFNGDGLPEIGIAWQNNVAVLDPKCKEADEEGSCKGEYMAWSKTTQDAGRATGLSAFDFDGDGKAELVYGDECYARVYNGETGRILMSKYRNSATQYVYPTIADFDGDGNTEIIVTSDGSQTCTDVEDYTYRGIRCKDNNDCISGACVGNLCRCTNDDQCNDLADGNQDYKLYRCLPPDLVDSNGGDVCRAVRGNQKTGLVILRDRLDRWVSSRTIWNQHNYNITNIKDDGTVPKTSEWKQNFSTPMMNSFRQQAQGATGPNAAPDLTGKFKSEDTVLIHDDDKYYLTAQVCNRGAKTVGSKMPAVFYKDSITADNVLCVARTDRMIPVKECIDVSCEITQDVAESLADQKIIFKANDDGNKGRSTVECNDYNNMDSVVIRN